MVPKIILLKSESDRNYQLWLSAIEVVFPGVDVVIKGAFSDKDWNELMNVDGGIIFATASGRSQWLKRIYDEKIWALSQNKNWMIYPPVQELFLYENKKLLRDWLMVHRIPHPKTKVFFDIKEALEDLAELKFPCVVKTNIGASGSGVRILNNEAQYVAYCNEAFGAGVQYKSGPKWLKGNLVKKIKKVLQNPKFIQQRLNEYKISKAEIQRDLVFVQEFVPHDFEWRCIRMGDSYFGHKKLAVNNMSSGTLLKGYGEVPTSLLDFLEEMTNRTGLISACIDVFETKEGYLVNEIQTFFGQSDPHQMLVDSIPGRYIKFNEEWIFEAGEFNRFESFELRAQHAQSLWNLRS